NCCLLILAIAISLYANALLAKLHEFGGTRHIRYRDLAGFIYGRKAYSLTWALQYINLFMINAGYIILAGSALKRKRPMILLIILQQSIAVWSYSCSK
ncbi:hypothetical protein S83_035931, partial [Arachis hypogaea]